MKKLALLAFLCALAFPLYSQNQIDTFTLLLGGTIGEFSINGGGNFNDLYTDRKLAYTGLVGLGNGETFLIGKYRIFKATGRSQLSNLDALGTADWKQTIITAGFRYHPGGGAFYLDVLFAYTHAEERIGTETPPVDVLSASEKLDDRGFGFALGISPKLFDPVAFNFEVEYTSMFRSTQNSAGRKIPNLGGFCYTAGISFYITQ